MQVNSRLAWLIIAAEFLVVVAAWLLLPFVTPKVVVHGPQTVSLYNAKMLATGCKLYALDHDGRFPVHLSELEPDYIPDVKSLRGVVRGQDEKDQYRYDWLYFGAGFTESNLPTVFLASPLVTVTPGKPQNRVVIKGDTSGIVLREEQYEKMQSETIRQMRALDEGLHPAKPAPGDSPAK